MPKPPSSEPLRRCDLNLFAADVDFLERSIGTGWTTYIRELVRKDVASRPRKQTIGDLANER